MKKTNNNINNMNLRNIYLFNLLEFFRKQSEDSFEQNESEECTTRLFQFELDNLVDLRPTKSLLQDKMVENDNVSFEGK